MNDNDSIGSLDELMLDQRRVLISGRLEPSTVNRAAAMLMTLDGRSDEPVLVMLNSSGGRLDDVVPLVDVMEVMRAPVELSVRGRAQATAAILATACGGERIAGATATISLKLELEVAGSSMTSQQLTAEADRLALLRRQLATRVAERTGQPEGWVLDQFDCGPIHPATSALDLGLVDRVES
jgi:ATP-dependent protease ClpP protease subunit